MNIKTMRDVFVIGMALAVAALLPGCVTVYTPEIQQGNVITQEMIDKLKPGMTHSQVRYVLGTPLITDPFHQDRWDYYYYLKKGTNDPAEAQRVTIIFKKDALLKVQGNTRIKNGETTLPPASPAAAKPASSAPLTGAETKPNTTPLTRTL